VIYKEIMTVCLYNQERIILKWIIKKWDEKVWTGFIWLRIGTGGGHV
jgi:hypothetical protein